MCGREIADENSNLLTKLTTEVGLNYGKSKEHVESWSERQQTLTQPLTITQTLVLYEP